MTRFQELLIFGLHALCELLVILIEIIPTDKAGQDQALRAKLTLEKFSQEIEER